MNKIGAICIGWLYQFCINSVLWIGIFLPYILKDLKIESSDTVWIISVHSCIIFTSTLLGGYMCDRIGLVITSLIGTGLYCIGLVTACASTEYIHFIMSYSIVGGLGSGILFNVSIVLSPLWWKKEHRIFSTSLLLSGAGIGATVYSNIIPILERNIGWRWTLFAYGTFSGVILLIIAIFTKANEKPSKFNNTAFIQLQNYKFWILWLAGCMFSLAYLSIFLYYPYMLRSIEYFSHNPTLVPVIYSLIGITMTLVRIVVGIISFYKYTLNPLIIINITMVTLSINVLVLPLNTSLTHSVIFSVLYGIQFSLIFSMFPLTVIQIFNTSYVPTLIGLVLTSYTVGVLIGPYIFSILLSVGGTYWAPCVFCAGCFAVSALLWSILFSKIHHKLIN